MKIIYPKKFRNVMMGDVNCPAFAIAHLKKEGVVEAIHPMSLCWDFIDGLVQMNKKKDEWACPYNQSSGFPDLNIKWPADKSVFEDDKFRLVFHLVPKYKGSIDRFKRTLAFLNELEMNIGFEPTVFWHIKEEDVETGHWQERKWGVIEADIRWTQNSMLFHTYKTITRICLSSDFESYKGFVTKISQHEYLYGHGEDKILLFLHKMLPALAKAKLKNWNGHTVEGWNAYTHQGPATLFTASDMSQKNYEAIYEPTSSFRTNEISKLCHKMYHE